VLLITTYDAAQGENAVFLFALAFGGCTLISKILSEKKPLAGPHTGEKFLRAAQKHFVC
jgi:hypothetical protein